MKDAPIKIAAQELQTLPIYWPQFGLQVKVGRAETIAAVMRTGARYVVLAAL